MTEFPDIAAPAPVLADRQVTERGILLPAADATDAVRTGQQVWVPIEDLIELDQAAEEGRFVPGPSVSADDALVHAGLAIRQPGDGTGDAMPWLQGTPQLHALLHPALDEHGGHPYDPAVHGPFYPGDPGTEPMVADAESQGYLRCLSCARLPVKFSRGRYQDNALDVEYDNALLLTLEGGYAMFVDDAPMSVVLCHDCASDFATTYPRLAQVAGYDLRTGHTHTQRHQDDHPDHVAFHDQARAAWAAESRGDSGYGRYSSAEAEAAASAFVTFRRSHR